MFLKANTSLALHQLACLIIDAKSDIDEYGEKIFEGQHLKVAARLLWKLDIPEAWHLLGWSILDNKINLKGNGEEIKEEERNEIVANLFREAKMPQSKELLAILIFNNNTAKDEDNNTIISDKQRINIAENLLIEADRPTSFAIRALIKLKYELQSLNDKKEALLIHPQETLNNSQNEAIQKIDRKILEVKKEALRLFAQSIQQGNTDVLGSYSILKKEIEEQEGIKKQEFEKARLERAAEKAKKQARKEAEARQQRVTIETIVPQNSLTQLELQEHIKEATEYRIEEEIGTTTTSTEGHQKRKALLKMLRKKNKDERKKKATGFKNLLKGKATRGQITDIINANDLRDEVKAKVIWTDEAWEEFKCLSAVWTKRIYTLIEDIKIGGRRRKPETLSSSEEISRRISQEHRLVYKKENGNIIILHCYGHYAYKRK